MAPPLDSRDAAPKQTLKSQRSESFTNPLWREHLIAGNPDSAYRRAVQDVNHRVIQYVRAAYKSDHHNSFITNHGQIDRLVALMAPAVAAGQLQVAQLTNAHLAELFGLKDVPAPDLSKLGRDGVTLEQELARPFWTAIKAAREGKPIEEALAAGEHRMERMLATDLQLAKVKQSREALKASEFRTYQRIAGPNACWLCSIAATQTYFSEDLLPIHPGCGCDVAPMPDGGQKALDKKLDPGHVLSEDASQIKLMTPMVESDAPAADYRELIAVREHSETGPTLTWAHQKFTGPGDLKTLPSKEVLSQEVYDTVRKNGGITIDLAGNQPADGYAYAPYKTTEFKVAEAEFTPKHVDDYIDSHHKELALPGNNLGMWVQDGYVYLDVSKVGPPTVETFAKAQAADQLAVFDLGNFNEIQLGTIDPKGYHPLGTPADLHRQYREQVARADETVGAGSPLEVPADAGSGRKRRAEPVTWTGPPLAPPVSSKQIDLYWQQIDTFDDNKDLIRRGARDAERLGYPGWPLEPYGGRAFSSKPSKEDLFHAGGEFVSRAARSKPTKHDMYRGIQVSPEQLDQLRSAAPGTRISMPISSFTNDPILAEAFAQGNPFMDPTMQGQAWKPKGTPDGPLRPLIFRLEKGAKLADVQNSSKSILEHLGFGEFEITKVEPGGSKLWDYVDAPFHRNVKFTVVTVRQTSMIEDGVTSGKMMAAGPKAKGGKKIPEFEIVKQPSVPKTVKGKSKTANDRGEVYIDIGHHTAKTYKPRFEFVPDATELLDGVPMLLPDNVIDKRAVPQIKNAVHDMMTKYPFVRLEYVGPPMQSKYGVELDKGIGSSFAMTMPVHPMPINTKGDIKWASRISLNPQHFNPGAPYEEGLRRHKDGVDSGFFHSHGKEGPIYQTVVHEFGHAIVNESGDAAVKKVNKTLTDLFKKEYPELVPKRGAGWDAKEAYKDAYDKWLRQNLSGYSFGRSASGAISPHEALAEAFADVEILGDKASAPAKALHDMMVREAIPLPDLGPGRFTGYTQEDVDKLKKKAGLKMVAPAKTVADKEKIRAEKKVAADAKKAAAAAKKAAADAEKAAKAAAKAEKDRLEAERRGPPPGETRKLLPNGKPLPPKAERVAELRKRQPEFVSTQLSRYDELTEAEKTAGRRWYADQCTAASNQALDGKQGFLPIQGVAVNVALSPQTKYDWNTAQGAYYLSHPRGAGFEAIRNMPKSLSPKAMQSNAERADRVSGATTYEEVMDALHEKGDAKKLSNYFRSAWVKGHPADVPNRGDIFTVDTWAVRTMDHSQAEIREVLGLKPGTRLTERQESRGEQLLSAEKYGIHWEWDKTKDKWVPLPNYRSVDMIGDDYDVFREAGVIAASKAPMFPGTYESRFNESTGRYETVMVDDKPSPWNPEDFQAALWGQIVPAAPPGK